jgi:hypothetical protein
MLLYANRVSSFYVIEIHVLESYKSIVKELRVFILREKCVFSKRYRFLVFLIGRGSVPDRPTNLFLIGRGSVPDRPTVQSYPQVCAQLSTGLLPANFLVQ